MSLAGFGLDPRAQAAAPPPSDAELSAYLDGAMAPALQRADIAGAVVVVVKDGRVAAARGYGLADVASRRPVDPELTGFRLASVSKLFTWTAVMQLVEAGKLDLDADVNRYLDFRIAPRFGRPITLRELMTHSAGFEEQRKGMFLSGPAHALTLEQTMKRRLPRQVFPPGEVTAYSNYGAALAGYIVQRVSGQPFDAYVRDHIFRPLGMNRTSFVQPSAGVQMASGYRLASGSAVPQDYLQPQPAGGAVSTGADMARFMIAQLEQGGPILRPATVALMQQRASPVRSRLNAWAHGFWEDDHAGRRLIGHGGNIGQFHTYLELAPDRRLGLFMALNSDGTVDDVSLMLATVRGVVDRYWQPKPTPMPPAIASSAADGRALAGAYVGSRRSVGDFLSIAMLYDQPRLVANPDGSISFDAYRGLGGAQLRWREVDRDLWAADGGWRLEVVRDARGRVRYLTSDAYPPVQVFQPAAWWQNGPWVLAAIRLGLGLLGVGLVVAGAAAAAAWRRRSPGAMAPGLLAAAAAAQAVALWLWISLARGPEGPLYGDGLDPWLRLLQGAGVAGFAATLVLSALIWRRPGPSAMRLARSAAVAATLGGLIAAWVSLAFHLWSFSLRY